MSAVESPGQSHNMSVLSTVVHLLGVSILAYCFALRTTRENVFSFRTWNQISWARWLVILVFLDSWIFLFFSGLLISGANMSHSLVACNLGIYSCIFFYGSSKVLIYLFLIEKVYVVWPHRGSRWTSRPYLVCLAIMSGYVVIIVMMILGKVAFHRDDGQCVIGLKKHVSISLLSYDLFLNIFLTGMFMWPLNRHKFTRPTIRRVAARTLVAALAALTTSTVNVAVITVLHGVELGWVCLASCGTDVTINAIILFWVTSANSGESSTPGPTAPPSDRGTKPILPRNGSEVLSGRIDEQATVRSTRLTFTTPSSRKEDSQKGDSHIYPPALREEENPSETENKAEKPKGLFTKLGGALGRPKKSERRDETMSVQVTITTEYEVVEETRHSRIGIEDRGRRARSLDYSHFPNDSLSP